MFARYNAIIRDVASERHTDHVGFGESFRDELIRAAAKPFTNYSFAAFYRDYMLRELVLRRSFDEIARTNKWQFHIDGVHLNTNGGRILAEAVQQFLDC